MHPEIQHKHVIIRAEINKPPTDVKETENWYRDFVTAMGMEILQGPYVVYHEQPGNRGLTGIVTITTSHSALHVWDESSPAVMQFDLYTCGEMDLSVVVEKLKIFEPTSIKYKCLDRATDLKDLGKGDLIF